MMVEAMDPRERLGLKGKGKGTRASKPKVKTGCKTCKIRRLKCDETKPTCMRCQKFGVDCDGYEVEKQMRSQRRILPRSSSVFQPIFYDISTPVFRDEREHHYFQVFYKDVASQLAGGFNPTLWNRLILQECERNVSIRHAIVAIAALNQASLRDPLKERTSGNIDAVQHHAFALKQYGKAISQMRKSMAQGNQDLRTTLITCLVLFCFETFHGNHESAVKQVTTGLELIEAWLIETSQTSMCETGSPFRYTVEQELIQAFGRLDIQAMTFIDPRSTTCHRTWSTYGQGRMRCQPPAFQSVEEARGYLKLAMQRTMHFMASIMPAVHSKGCLKLDTKVCVPDDCIEGRKEHLAELDRWYATFVPLMEKERHSPLHVNYFRCLLLNLAYLTSYFAAAIIRSSDQPYPQTRSHMPYFTRMIAIAKSILAHPCMAADKGVYSIEIQVVCPLYAVAWRCPHKLLRREAISLLLSGPRREALWDSILAGKLAQWIMNMEEENYDELYAPEHLRSNDVDIVSFDMKQRRAHVRCLIPEKESGEYQPRETVLTW